MKDEDSTQAHPRWGAFLVVTSAYLGVTLTESILAPIYPVIAEDLDLGVGVAGIAFGALSVGIGIGNLAGGYLLWRLGPRLPVIMALITATIGSSLMTMVGGGLPLVAAQTLMGASAGLFFPAGVSMVSSLAGSTRRGLAMGLFGVAFSGGLTSAALLAAFFGDADRWQAAFWISAAVTGIALVMNLPLEMPHPSKKRQKTKQQSLLSTLTIPVFVATVATLMQYGTVSFFALFAVSQWEVSAPAAAAMIAAGRIVSIAGKLAAGWAADRWGSTSTLWGLGTLLFITGIWWTLVPGPIATIWAIVIFTAAVSAVFPIANLLAVEGFGDEGRLLGTFRFVTMILGGAGTFLMGQAADAFGLQPTLAITVLLPLLFFAVRQSREAPAVLDSS